MPGKEQTVIISFQFPHTQNQYYFTSYSTEDAQVIFRDAALYNMTEAGHAWIVTEQALHANNTPVGVLGLVLEHANSDKGHIRVSMNEHN